MDINELKKTADSVLAWHLQSAIRQHSQATVCSYQIQNIRKPFRTSEIPDNILEAIARTMLPDIREFFLKRDRRSLPLGKRNMKRIRRKEHKVKGEGESPAFSSLLIDKFIQDNSRTLLWMLFIRLICSIWLVDFNCSVTPSFSAVCRTKESNISKDHGQCRQGNCLEFRLAA